MKSVLVTDTFIELIFVAVILIALILIGLLSLISKDKVSKKSILFTSIASVVLLIGYLIFAFNLHVVTMSNGYRIHNNQVIQTRMTKSGELSDVPLKTFGKITIISKRTKNSPRIVVDRTLTSTKITRYVMDRYRIGTH